MMALDTVQVFAYIYLQFKIWRLHVTLDTLRPYGSQSSMKFKRSHPCNDTILVLLILHILG